MRMTPFESNTVISLDDLTIELEAQFKQERPLMMRYDWLNHWMISEFGFSIVDDKMYKAPLVDIGDVEEKISELDRVEEYFTFRKLITRFFDNHYNIAIDDEVDFEAIYSLYIIFILSPLDYMVKYIKGFYQNNIDTKIDKISETDNKTTESIRNYISLESDSQKPADAIIHLDGQSKTYDAILQVMSNIELTLESYLETIETYEPGNSFIEALQDELHLSFTIAVNNGDDFKNALLKPYLDDPVNTEAVLNSL